MRHSGTIVGLYHLKKNVTHAFGNFIGNTLFRLYKQEFHKYQELTVLKINSKIPQKKL